MDGVIPTPLDVGRKSHDPSNEADDVVPPPGTKEGSVTAIVHHDKGANEQATRRNREQQDQPIVNFHGEAHQHQTDHQRNHGGTDLSDCGPIDWLLILRH